jgi:hypothetical protein
LHVTFCYSFRQFERIVNILPKVVKFLFMNLLSVSKSKTLKVVLAELMALILIYDICDSYIRESIFAMLCYVSEFIESFLFNKVFFNKLSLYFLFNIFWFIDVELNVYSNIFYCLILLLFSLRCELFLKKSLSYLSFKLLSIYDLNWSVFWKLSSPF